MPQAVARGAASRSLARPVLNSAKSATAQRISDWQAIISDVVGPPSKSVMLLMMYIIVQERGARDFGAVRPQPLAGMHSSKIQWHHIFPFNFLMLIFRLATAMFACLSTFT